MYEPLIRFAARGATPRPAPINPAWIEDGEPHARSVPLAVSDDRAAVTVLWECTAGRFTWRYDFDETIHIIGGAVTICAPGEPDRRLTPGDTIHFSRGAVATWTVDEYVRKIAFCRRAPPRPLALALRVARALQRRAGSYLRIRPAFSL
jgi:uncharacterized cupin superfamily protein